MKFKRHGFFSTFLYCMSLGARTFTSDSYCHAATSRVHIKTSAETRALGTNESRLKSGNKYITWDNIGQQKNVTGSLYRLARGRNIGIKQRKTKIQGNTDIYMKIQTHKYARAPS